MGTVRIIGIDPGLRRTGWGVIESDGARLRYIASGLVVSEPDAPLAYRLLQLHDGLSEALVRHKPREAAIEETFVNRDGRATLKLGHARGIALLAPAACGLIVSEYAPNVVKKTVVGSGHADKRQIRVMLGHLLPRARPESNDEADALAIALCHAHHRRSRALLAATATP